MINKIVSILFSFFFVCVLFLFATLGASFEYLLATFNQSSSADGEYSYYLRPSYVIKTNATEQELLSFCDTFSTEYDLFNRGYIPMNAYKEGFSDKNNFVIYGANEFAYNYYEMFLSNGDIGKVSDDGKIPVLLNKKMQPDYKICSDFSFEIGSTAYVGFVSGFIENNVMLPAVDNYNFNNYKLSLSSQIVIPYSMLFLQNEINDYYLPFQEDPTKQNENTASDMKQRKPIDYLKEQPLVIESSYKFMFGKDKNVLLVNGFVGTLLLYSQQITNFSILLLTISSIFYFAFTTVNEKNYSKKYYALKNISVILFFFVIMLTLSLVLYNLVASSIAVSFVLRYLTTLPILLGVMIVQCLLWRLLKNNKIKFVEKELQK